MPNAAGGIMTDNYTFFAANEVINKTAATGYGTIPPITVLTGLVLPHISLLNIPRLHLM